MSGLTLGTFVRLENECKTGMELWAPSDPPPDIPAALKSPDASRCTLVQAIENGDLAEAEKILAESPGT